MKKLKQGAYSKGYNSFDHPIELKEQEAQKFQNLYPREGIASQREGTSYLDKKQLNLISEDNPDLKDKEEQGMAVFDCVGVRYFVHFFKGCFAYYRQDNKVVAVINYPMDTDYKDSIIIDDTLIIQSETDRFMVYPVDVGGVPNKVSQHALVAQEVNIERRQSYWFCLDEHEYKTGNTNDFLPSSFQSTRQDSSKSYYADGITLDEEIAKPNEANTRMWAYYLITYVRRIDSDAMDNTGNALETTVFSNGLYETAADFEKDTRFVFKRKGPLNIDNYTFNSSGNAGVYGDYYYDAYGTGKLFKITEATYDADVTPLVGCVEVPFSDVVEKLGVPNTQISYPKSTPMSLVGGGVNQGHVDVNTGSPITIEDAQGYTHVRIYRTLFAPTQAEAKGSSFRFLVDRPINLSDNSFYIDTTTDAELTGSLHSYNKFGSQPTPEGKMSYVNGRLWTCPSLLSEGDGRAYYSDGVYSPIDLIANLWHSQTATNWVTIDSNGTEVIRAVIPEQEDIALMGDSSVWYIIGGDPSISGPQRASSDLGIVGHKAWSSSEYGKRLRNEFSDTVNILLLDPIYDERVLSTYRSRCLAYVHGHSAGGTNPSLVEMMHFEKPIIAFDCVYNRASMENNGVFFDSVEALKDLIQNAQELPGARELRNVAQRRYNWNIIRQQYLGLFKH
mgnify:CR=1 FL=1